MLKKVVLSLTLLALPLLASAEDVAMPDVPAAVLSAVSAAENLRAARRTIAQDQPFQPGDISGDSALDLTSMPLSQLVGIYFQDVARGPYVICSEVLADNRLVSVRAGGALLDNAVLGALLAGAGYELTEVGGVAHICRPRAPLSMDELAGPHGQLFSYEPLYRSVDDLVRQAAPVVRGVFSAQGRGSHTGGTESATLASAEKLVFSGEPSQVERLKIVLRDLDVAVRSVTVRAVLYEVGEHDQSSSLFKILGDVLGGRLGISLSGGLSPFGNSLSLKTSSFEAIASTISEDGRFSVLSAPFVRVRNGRSAEFQVGQDVPVQSNIVISDTGKTTAGYSYVSSGVLLNVTAYVHGRAIDLDLTQEVSSAVRTTVSDSVNPTINRRRLSSSLTVTPGEVVILGGLSDRTSENVGQGIFSWNPFKSHKRSNSELFLILQADLI